MFYILLILLLINILLIIYLINNVRSNNMKEVMALENEKLRDKINVLETNIQNGIYQNIDNMKMGLFNNLNTIDDRMEKRLAQEFLKSSNIFTEISKRLTKVDEAQKNITSLSENIVSLEKILNDKKTRGSFGEIQLNHILENVFGFDNKGRLYDTQYDINTKKVDAIILMENEKIPIDSKFPLENYNKLQEDISFEKEFKKDLKKHIDDISSKYVVHGITTQAIMFIPSESIYSYINAYMEDTVFYSYSKMVYMASPSTIMAMLTAIQSINVERERYKNIDVIHKELIKLSKEFEMYNKRWKNIFDKTNTLKKAIDDFEVTNNKLIKEFEKINKVEIK